MGHVDLLDVLNHLYYKRGEKEETIVNIFVN